MFWGFNGIRTRDLCVSAAVLQQLSLFCDCLNHNYSGNDHIFISQLKVSPYLLKNYQSARNLLGIDFIGRCSLFRLPIIGSLRNRTAWTLSTTEWRKNVDWECTVSRHIFPASSCPVLSSWRSRVFTRAFTLHPSLRSSSCQISRQSLR